MYAILTSLTTEVQSGEATTVAYVLGSAISTLVHQDFHGGIQLIKTSYNILFLSSPAGRRFPGAASDQRSVGVSCLYLDCFWTEN